MFCNLTSENTQKSFEIFWKNKWIKSFDLRSEDFEVLFVWENRKKKEDLNLKLAKIFKGDKVCQEYAKKDLCELSSAKMQPSEQHFKMYLLYVFTKLLTWSAGFKHSVDMKVNWKLPSIKADVNENGKKMCLRVFDISSFLFVQMFAVFFIFVKQFLFTIRDMSVTRLLLRRSTVTIKIYFVVS